jgi:hypothetical protein
LSCEHAHTGFGRHAIVARVHRVDAVSPEANEKIACARALDEFIDISLDEQRLLEGDGGAVQQCARKNAGKAGGYRQFCQRDPKAA